MNSMLITILGLLAGALTTFAQLPQLFKVLKTKSVDDISKGMYAMLIMGVFLWVLYGIFIFAIPIILANTIALALVITILFLDLKYGRATAETKEAD